jgi:hypothetical protein
VVEGANVVEAASVVDTLNNVVEGWIVVVVCIAVVEEAGAVDVVINPGSANVEVTWAVVDVGDVVVICGFVVVVAAVVVTGVVVVVVVALVVVVVDWVEDVASNWVEHTEEHSPETHSSGVEQGCPSIKRHSLLSEQAVVSESQG